METSRIAGLRVIISMMSSTIRSTVVKLLELTRYSTPSRRITKGGLIASKNFETSWAIIPRLLTVL